MPSNLPGSGACNAVRVARPVATAPPSTRRTARSAARSRYQDPVFVSKVAPSVVAGTRSPSGRSVTAGSRIVVAVPGTTEAEPAAGATSSSRAASYASEPASATPASVVVPFGSSSSPSLSAVVDPLRSSATRSSPRRASYAMPSGRATPNSDVHVVLTSRAAPTGMAGAAATASADHQRRGEQGGQREERCPCSAFAGQDRPPPRADRRRRRATPGCAPRAVAGSHRTHSSATRFVVRRRRHRRAARPSRSGAGALPRVTGRRRSACCTPSSRAPTPHRACSSG
ncbi:MAG: hypothetical protein KatS3mg010_0257 [Acidimicrobiia bacterium]|nr:MAG: hypothetical protein KatS3mg010_0257 [Acidimicrobiia bacterium]